IPGCSGVITPEGAMRKLPMLLVFAAAMWAQNPAGNPAAVQSTPPETAKDDLCTLEGRVTHAQSGEPVNKVRVQLNRMDPGPAGPTNSYTTTTDAAGKFAMKALEPGQYRLSVTRTGFLTMQYGSRAPGRPGGTLTLSKGQHMKDADFRLWAQGVVS